MPQQLPGLTAACSHFSWVLGSWLTQPLDTASSPSRKLTLEPPVCWGAPSSGVLALMLPEKFLSPWVKSIHLPYFKPKGTYPSSPSPSGKLLFQVSNPSPRTLFEKQNISDGKRCHWSHTRTKPQSHKEQDIFPHHKLPVGALLQKTQQTKAQSPLSLQACPLQNPTQAQKAAGSQPSGRPGGRSGGPGIVAPRRPKETLPEEK